MANTNSAETAQLRHIPLEGADNLRDIGGFAAPGGGTVRWGAVYRSDSLSALTDADVARVAELDLAAAIDFRDQSEIDGTGKDRLPAGVEGDHIAILDLSGADAGSFVKAMRGEGAAGLQDMLGDGAAAKYMEQTYLQFVQQDRAHKGFGRAVSLVAGTTDDKASLYHCHSGKDRTGWMTAILLSLAGVDREVIFEDYLSSNDYLRESNEKLFAKIAEAGIDADLFRPVMEQSRTYLQTSFDAVAKDYGDMEGYATKALGLSDATITSLRTRLIR